MQDRDQMQKPGHRGARHNPSSKIRTCEVNNVVKSAHATLRRTDVGHVKITKSQGRGKDYLIKD